MMNTDLTVRLPCFSTPFSAKGSEERNTKIMRVAWLARKSDTLTSPLIMASIHSSLENNLSNHIHSPVAMKIFFDINSGGNILKKEYVFKAVENAKLDIIDLFPIFESILVEFDQALENESGNNLTFAYTMFVKYDSPKIKFKELFTRVSNRSIGDGSRSYSQKKIHEAFEFFLRLNQRPEEPQIDENFEFIVR